MSSRLRLTLAAAVVVPLAVLLASVRVNVGWWDPGDLQVVAWIAGIPYPTGFPGYVLLGWVWTHAIPFGEPAARLNALSAVAIAVSSGSVCALALLFDALPVFAVLGAWTFAFAFSVWERAAYADAHPVGFAVALAAIVCGLTWERLGTRRMLDVAIVLGGVAVAIDDTTLLILIGGTLVALARPWPRRAFAAFACALLLVVLAYAWLPLRSAQVTAQRLDPTLALGVAPGRPYFDDHHPADRDNFANLVLGLEWGAGPALGKILTVPALRTAAEKLGPRIEGDFPEGLALAGVLGLLLALPRAPLPVIGLVLAAAVPALFGGSYPPEADSGRYLFTFEAVVGAGVALAASRAVRAFGARDPAPASAIVAALLAFVLVYDAVRGHAVIARRDNDEALRFGDRVVAQTKPDAIVVATWDFATPLAYRAFVRRDFDRRIVLTAFAEDYAVDIRRWSRERQVVLVGSDHRVAGTTMRPLGAGSPVLYEVQP